MDSGGNLYGTASVGGAHADGTVFEVAQGSGTITTLASFSGTNGATPRAGLIMDSSGNLYGAASAGGARGDGTVFELAKGSSTITALASFNGTNGLKPLATLIMDSSGNLYGTTSAGGAGASGTVFELASGSGTITTLASFNGTKRGNSGCRSGRGRGRQSLWHNSQRNRRSVRAGPRQRNDHQAGFVQRVRWIRTTGLLDHRQRRQSVRHNVAGSVGRRRQRVRAGPGQRHDHHAGFVQRDRRCKARKPVWSWTAAATFMAQRLVVAPCRMATYSSWPRAAARSPRWLRSTAPTVPSLRPDLVMDSSGNLYGTAIFGGASSDGTVFELAHGSGNIIALASFNGTNGAAAGGRAHPGQQWQSVWYD